MGYLFFKKSCCFLKHSSGRDTHHSVSVCKQRGLSAHHVSEQTDDTRQISSVVKMGHWGLWLKVCFLLLVYVTLQSASGKSQKISRKRTLVWGPGLNAKAVLPARYFFIQAVDKNGLKWVEREVLIFFLKKLKYCSWLERFSEWKKFVWCCERCFFQIYCKFLEFLTTLWLCGD